MPDTQTLVDDHDVFVQQLLAAKDGQEAKAILIPTSTETSQGALDEAIYSVKQTPGGTTLTAIDGTSYVIRTGRSTDAFVSSCLLSLDERRASRSVSKARDEASTRSALERRGEEALQRVLNLADSSAAEMAAQAEARKRQREAEDLSQAQPPQVSAEGFGEAFLRVLQQAAVPVQPVAVMAQSEAQTFPEVQLILFKPQIGRNGDPLAKPLNSVATDDNTQKFLRQTWDVLRQTSVNGALRDNELGMLNPFAMLRGTPAECKDRLFDLRTKLRTFCSELKDTMKAKSSQNSKKGSRIPPNATVDPAWLKEHINVYVTMLERLVGTLYPQDEDGWRPYIWAAVTIIAEVANQALLYTQGCLVVLTEYRAQIANLRYDPQALVNKVLARS